LFEKYGVFSRKELDSFVEVDTVNYTSVINLEALALVNLSNRYVIPASISYQNDLLTNSASIPAKLKEHVKNLIGNSYDATSVLSDNINALSKLESHAAARYANDVVKAQMKVLRTYLDSLEEVVDQKYWPYPTYEEILLARHKVRDNSCNFD